ncbi:MAG: hypothetical protein HYV26_23705, partial [Candidatus Hydrogenedentes bacterium]|nr:hypothetical protein [Candidatus Hydrogenedentota bacterium]
AGRAARAAVQAGHVGKVTQVTGWGQRNPEGGDLSRNGPPPAELDWDAWLGPARWVAYNPDRVHGNFRWLLDFGGGQICHQADHCFAMALAASMKVLDPGKGTGLEAPATVHVEAQGTVPTAGLWDCPVDLRVEYRLEPGGPSMSWRQGPPRRDAAFGVEMSGPGGNVVVSTCDERASTEEKVLLAAGAAASEMQEDVLENWLRCIATRETPEIDLERGTFAATLCILGNLAYRLGRPLDWDPRAQRFVNDSLADRLIVRPPRGQYHL